MAGDNHSAHACLALTLSKEVKLACKPGSVEDSHSSRRPITRTLKQPTRRPREPRDCLPIWSCSGWGLTCRSRCRARGALLPHLFTLAVRAWTLLGRFEFLYHFPWPHGLRPLTGTPLCGARTFLSAPRARSDCPASFVSSVPQSNSLQETLSHQTGKRSEVADLRVDFALTVGQQALQGSAQGGRG